MSQKERERLTLFSQVKDGQMTLKSAAELLGLSYRHARRSYGRFRQQGAEGLVHRLRGRASNHRGTDAALRERVLALCRQRYPDFGPTLAAEYLAKEHQLQVDHETLRRWLMASGQWKPRRDASRRHRRWRERKAHAGELVQMDGSEHDWFEGRRGKCVLMVMIDDATGWTWGQFHESETTEAAMRTLWSYIDQQGLPRGLYVDRDSIYRVNRPATAQENLCRRGPLTQFGRAMEQLGVELICAHSPQAKGRVERMNKTLQDRLPKALRLAGIADLEGANAFLAGQFLSEHNARFTVAAAERADLHHGAPPAERLRAVLSIQETRTVGNDYCLRFEGRWLQLIGRDANLGLRGKRVLVRQTLEGTLELEAHGRLLSYQALPQRPSDSRGAGSKPTLSERVAKHQGPHKPGAEHPWRRPATAALAPLRLAALACAEPGQR